MESGLAIQVKKICAEDAAKCSPDDTVGQFRNKALKRGISTISKISKSFKIIDRDGTGKLNKEEFKIGCKQWGVTVEPEELDKLFMIFDKNKDGTVDYDEFLAAVRPPMSEERVLMVIKAFNKLIDVAQGKPENENQPTELKGRSVTLEQFAKVYSVKEHPKFKNGEMTKEQIIKQFIDHFQQGDDDDVITFDEFLNYYAVLGLSLDSNALFNYMMKKSWGISAVNPQPDKRSRKC